MNIDDFLDKSAAGEEPSDILDLSKEDVSMDVPIETSSVVATISSEPRSDIKVDSQEVPTPSSSHASAAVLTTTEVPVRTPNVTAVTFVQKIKMHVANIKSSLEQKKLGDAMNSYSQLTLLSKKVPIANESARHRIDTLLLNLNNELQKTVSEEKTKCLVAAKRIELLLERGMTELVEQNPVKAQRTYEDVSALFETLPSYFSDVKHDVNTRIIQFHLKLTKYKKQVTTARFKQEFEKIKSLLQTVSLLIADKRYGEARKMYDDVEHVYHTMEDGFLGDKSRLYAVMLKKKHTLDVAMQIQSLQRELGGSVKVLGKPDVELKVVAAPIVVEKTVDISKESVPVENYSNVSVINEAIKNVKLSKARMLLINEEFAQAFLILTDLRKRFPKDEGVEETYTQLQKNPSSPSSEALRTEAALLSKELSRVDKDLAQGHVREAVAELERMEENEQNPQLKGILQDLESAISKKPGPFESQDAKFVRRKLLLAKHHYDKHHFSKTKEYASLVLKHDPKNREARKLYALVT